MLRKSRIFSRALKILVPVAIVAMPLMSFAATNSDVGTQSPAFLSKALSAHGTMAGENQTPIGMNLVTSLDRVPTTSGEKVNVLFTVTNTAPAKTKASLNNVVLSSRYLATNNKDLTVFAFPMKLMADSHYSGSLPYVYDGKTDLNTLLTSIDATARFDIYQYSEELRTSNPANTTIPRYTGLAVRSSTQTDTYWGRFELTVGFDETPVKAGDTKNIIFTVKSGNSIPGNKPRPNELKGITLYSRLLYIQGTNPTNTVLHSFPQTITETNEITWSMPYVFRGTEDLTALLSSVSAEGTATFSTYSVLLQTGPAVALPTEPTIPVTTTPDTTVTTVPDTTVTTTPDTTVTTTPDTTVTTTPDTTVTTVPDTTVTTTPNTTATTTPDTTVTTVPDATVPATTVALPAETATTQIPATTSVASAPVSVKGTAVTQSPQPTSSSVSSASTLPFTGSQSGLIIWWGLVLTTAGYLLNGAIKFKKSHSHN